MTAKEFLKKYEHANKRAQRFKAEYEKEMLLIDTIRSTSDNDGMPHGTNVGKPTEEKAIRLADKAMKWKMAELDAIQVRQEVFDVICEIDDIEGEILYERYVNLLKWEAVCLAVHRSWYAVHNHHRRALAMVQSILDKKTT